MRGLKKSAPHGAHIPTTPHRDMATLWLNRPSGADSVKKFTLGLGLENINASIQSKGDVSNKETAWTKYNTKKCLKPKIQAPVFWRETQGAGSYRAGRSGNTSGNWIGQDNENMFNLDHKRILQCQLGLEVDPEYFMVNLGVQLL